MASVTRLLPRSRIDTITEEQRADFAARVRRLAADGPQKKHTWEILSTLAHDRAVALTEDLWTKHEPHRRRKIVWRVRCGIIWLVLSIVSTISLLIVNQMHPTNALVAWVSALQFVAHINLILCLYRQGNLLGREQRGCLALMTTLKNARLTPAMIDALGINDLRGADPYRPALRLALIDALPAYAHSDAPPLDDYQQNVLRREIKSFSRRLRNQDTTAGDADAEFVVVAIRYLATIQVTKKKAEANAAVVEKIVNLPPVEGEPTACRAVRDVAKECLPLVQVKRQ